MYALTQGLNEAQIIEMCFRERRPLPEAIQNAPDLDLGLEFFWSAYWDLNSCRSMGFGPGPIPWTTLKDFARFQELDEDDALDFYYLMRAMDTSHLKHIEAQRDKDKAK